MRKCFLVLLLLFSCSFAQTTPVRSFEHFITARGDKLIDGDKELKFVSFNMPNLHYIEDNFNFECPNPWRLPTEYEIRDALKTIKMLGGKVTRIYIPAVRRPGESKDIIRYVEGPGKFNESAFQALDRVLQIANEEGIRVIIPFIDNWWWWGGPGEFAAFRGKDGKDFWKDSLLISDVKQVINFIVNRKNTLTGRLYKNDKAILGWETGNELDASFAWQHEIAGYIRSLDKNHLIIEGIRSPIVTPDEVSDPNFDVLTTHFYIPLTEATKDLLRNRELTKGKKPYFVGEFGYSSMSDVRAIVQTAKEQDVSGIMIWSMRGHRDEGGFYQHSEVFSGSYRFPGFPSGDYYHEKEVVDFMRQSAYNWGGENVPPLPKPEKPELLPISNVYEISWRGSVGATAYKIERKTAGTHEWTTLAENVSDADFAYRPLFSDTTAELGKSYVYRVSARNTSGISAPSKESAPVLVRYIKLFDDMSEPGKFADKSGSIDFIVHQDLFKAKQDNERIKASKGAYLIYKVPAHIDSIKVKLFFTTGPVGVDFSAADTSSEFKSVAAKLETFPSVLNFYNYFTPAEYTCAEFPPDSRMLKIKFNDDVQVGQVEIIYGTVPAIK